MKLAFLGSPSAAVPTLRALVDAGHDVALVVSGPDKRRGRGGGTAPTPVKAAAIELGLSVTDELDAVASAGVDLGVVVAYGRIIPVSLLDVVPMVNLHFSLLPRWRGAAPVERAVLAGDPTTGVCVMDVAEGLDTGDVHAVAEVPIGADTTAAELTERLAVLGADLLVDALAAGLGPGVAQPDDGVTYARKITTEDRHLDWSRPADELLRVVRIGGAWTGFRGARLKVVDAVLAQDRIASAPGSLRGTTVACGEGALDLVLVQPEGKGPMDASSWANGARPGPDEVLGNDGTGG